MSNTFTHNGKGVHYFRARHQFDSFTEAVEWGMTHEWLKRNNAILLARRLWPELYNEWIASKHPVVNGLRPQARVQPTGRHVQLLKMRLPNGKKMVELRGV